MSTTLTTLRQCAILYGVYLRKHVYIYISLYFSSICIYHFLEANNILLSLSDSYLYILKYTHSDKYVCIYAQRYIYVHRVASTSRLLQIVDLFCKRALYQRRYYARETYNFKEPINRSHPIARYTRSDVRLKYTHRDKYVCIYAQ